MTFLARLWNSVLKSNKLFLFFILLIINITSFFEFLTIGSIVPMISFLFQKKELALSNSFVRYIYDNLEIIQNIDLLFFFIILFVFLVFISTICKVLFIIFSNMYSRNIGNYIGVKIFSNFIFSSYTRIISRNNNDILSLVNSKTENVSYLIYNILTMLNSLIILLVIVFAMLIIIPNYTILAITIICFIYYLINFFTKNQIVKYGDDISKFIFLKYKIVSECLTTIREVFIHNGFNFFLNKFINADKKYRKAQMFIGVISSLPKIVLEFFGIIGICFLAYFLTANSEIEISTIIAYLAAISFSLYRTLPLINNIYASYTQINALKKTTIDVIDLLENNFLDKKYHNNKKLIFKSLLFKNVSYKYESSNSCVLKNANINLKSGLIYGIYGKTGVGKSTFLDLLSGLIKPTKGQIFLNGLSLNNKNIRIWQNSISVVSQNTFLLDDTIKNNIAFISMDKKIDLRKMEKICEDSLILDFIKKLPKKFDETIGQNGIKLSGGQKQRIGIARALWKDSEVLILDEATSALDFETEKLVFRKLKNINKTIFIVTHRISTLKYCDKILEIDNGLVYKK